MLIYRPEIKLTKFERIYMEADDKPRRNMRFIEIGDDNGKKSAKINDKETVLDIDIDDTGGDEEFQVDDFEPEDSDIDIEDDDGDIRDEPTEDNMDIDDTGEGVAGDIDIEDDDGGDTGTEDIEETSDDDGEASSAVDLETDETQDNDEGEGDTENTDNENGNNPEDIKEAIHKQALYRKFVRLHDATDNYTTKLEDVTGMDRESNHRYNQIINQLQQLKDFLFDFMVIKFKSESYVRCTYFYQRAVSVVNLLLDELDAIHREIKRKREEDEKSSNRRRKRKTNS